VMLRRHFSRGRIAPCRSLSRRIEAAPWVELDFPLPLASRGGKAAERSVRALRPPDQEPPDYTGGIMAVNHRSKLQCAYCGRARPLEKVMVFSLLTAGCKAAGVKLKAPRSIAFDSGCARRAFRAIQKSDFGERS
jgi:hypothetical protein